jgi:glutamyl-tRNA synthetase
VPLVVDASGRRLAKRSDDLSLAALREQGVDPRRIVSWVARRSGIAVDEPSRASELAARFDMNSVPRAPVVIMPADMVELGAAR